MVSVVRLFLMSMIGWMLFFRSSGLSIVMLRYVIMSVFVLIVRICWVLSWSVNVVIW